MADTTYSITKVDVNDMDRLKSDWERLFMGPEMTYFQSFDWNKTLAGCIKQDDSLVFAYYAISMDNEVVMIAPLAIHREKSIFKNRTTAYFIGKNSFSDYLNFIYKEFDPQACEYLFNILKTQYGCTRFCFDDLKSDSSTYKYLQDNHKSNILGETTDCLCAMLPLQGSVEEYTKSLSKSVRQNLRTAQNRANKDGIEFEINLDNNNADKELCKKIRNQWGERRNINLGANIGFMEKLTFFIRNTIKKKNVRFPDFLPIDDDPNTRIMTISNKNNGELASFFNYGIDYEHRQIVVMAAGVNEAYMRYSPGMLLMKHFIDSMIEQGVINAIDFTRGGEQYKFYLGAQERHNFSFTIKL